jgi:hypothetical protein
MKNLNQQAGPASPFFGDSSLSISQTPLFLAASRDLASPVFTVFWSK